MCVCAPQQMLVKNDDKLDLGNGHELTFIMAPNLHWPDTIFTFDAKTQCMFTCDAYGMHYCSDEVRIRGSPNGPFPIQVHTSCARVLAYERTHRARLPAKIDMGLRALAFCMYDAAAPGTLWGRLMTWPPHKPRPFLHALLRCLTRKQTRSWGTTLFTTTAS